MKTNNLKNMLIIVMAAMAMPMMAQDNNYVNVNLKDGNSSKFYLKDVTGIFTSKIDAQGKQQADYQFQYVTTADGDYVYDLDNIDNLTFVKSDEATGGEWRRSLIVATLDGATMEYLIDKNTKVRVEKPNLVIETDGMVLNYELEKMGQVRYGRRFIPSRVGRVMVDNQPFKWKDETIFFDHLPDNTLIEVLNVDGKLVMSRNYSGNAQLSLQSLVNGVYLVKLNKTTYKILKR